MSNCSLNARLHAMSLLLGSLLVCGLFVSQPVKAEPFSGLGTQVLVDRQGTEESIHLRQPLALQLGYRFSLADAAMEYSQYSYSQGSSLVKVAARFDQWMLWGRHVFSSQWKFDPYAALGWGLRRGSVELTLGQETSQDKGEFEPVAGLAAGFSALMNRRMEFLIEARSTVVNSEVTYGASIFLVAHLH